MILNNIIEGGGIAGVGIKFDGPYNIDIYGNVVYGCATGISGLGGATIGRNLIIDNEEGIELSSSRILIQNNTIADNSIGIKIRYYAVTISRNSIQKVLTITRNNIQNNSQNSIYLEDARGDVDATANWWGTIDTQLINLTIHDRKNEPKLGIVTFVPTLSDPVPEAPTTTYTPITQPHPPSQGSTTQQGNGVNNQTNNQTGVYVIAVAAIILSVIINISLAVVITVLLRKNR